MNDFPFRSGDLVLSEWNDGKLYYAYIQTILQESGQCIVLFEDLNYYCVAYDKIHSGMEEKFSFSFRKRLSLSEEMP